MLKKLLPIAFLTLGLLVLLGGFVVSVSQGSVEFFRSKFLFPSAVGICLIIIGITYPGKFRESGLWFSLALIGQSAALQLIFAGSTVHYQHYNLHQNLFTIPTILYITIICLEGVLVLWKIIKNWSNIVGWLRKIFQPWQLILIGLLFIFSSAALSRVILDYVYEVLFATLIQLINLIAIILAVLTIPDPESQRISETIDRIFESKRVIPRLYHIDFFIVVCTLWIFGITSLLSYFIYQRHPHVQDEVIYLYQAKYLSEGSLTTPAPKAPDGFCIYLIPCRESNWYSPFPPGWPAILGAGVVLGIPWLVNPLLASINIILAYIFFKFILPLRYARLATVLLCVSPWYIYMGMNFMSHTLMLTCVLAASVCGIKVSRSGRVYWAGISGVFVGLLSLIRNLDSLAIGALIGAVLMLGNHRLRIKSFLWFIGGALLVGSLILPYNKAITGNPFTLPLSKYYVDYFGPKVYSLGFGPDRGINWPIDPYPGYSPLEAVINIVLNTFSVNVELFGWSSGSLLLVSLFIVWGYKFFNRTDFLMITGIVVTIGMYSMFWFSGGPDFGARYWFLIVIPLVYLSVRAIQIIENKSENPLSQVLGSRITQIVLGLCLLTIVNYLPWRALDKYYQYLEMRPDVRELVKTNNFGKSLVLVQGNLHPDYESAWIYNPLNPDVTAPLFFFDKSPDVRSQVLKAFSDRPIWVLQGPTITGGPYRLVAGPISLSEAEELLK